MSDIDPHTAERLLRQCRDLLEHDLGELIEELAPAIAEEVLALIDSTRDEARKAEYLRLRTDLQSRWETLTSAYRKELSRQLQPGKLVTTSKPETPNFADLQIVNDKDLAEQIVMREFVGRVSEACSEEIYALDRRIGYLNGSENLDEGDTIRSARRPCAQPFAPAVRPCTQTSTNIPCCCANWSATCKRNCPTSIAPSTKS
ncbi:MAG: DUF1631 family protein [Sulfuritalea sp.]|nr:DUF1631 family protein [Sulfuritalea sp.]